jgi:hypothetical protein
MCLSNVQHGSHAMFSDENRLKTDTLEYAWLLEILLKYEVVRFSLDLIDLYLVECATALNFNLRPIRLFTCNSHTNEYAKGVYLGRCWTVRAQDVHK